MIYSMHLQEREDIRLKKLEEDILLLKMAKGIELNKNLTSTENLWLLALRQSMKSINVTKSSSLQKCLESLNIDTKRFAVNFEGCESPKKLNCKQKKKASAYSILCAKIALPNNDRLLSILANTPPIFNDGLKRSHIDDTNNDAIILGRKELDDIIKVYATLNRQTL